MGKRYFRFSGSTAVAGIGKALCGLMLGLIVCTDDVAAATYFISPTGADSNPGVATTSPWLTFAHAMSRTLCGDILVLKDGAYKTAVHGSLKITKSCTEGNTFTVRAQNQRAAHLQGDGSVEVLTINDSAYVTVDGLGVTSADNNTAAGNPVNVLANNKSSNIILRNLLVSRNNRYRNTALVRFGTATNSLIEDSELYSFHRHGVAFSSGANNNVGRRLYANSRAYADISGGYISGNDEKGDAAFTNYPGPTTFMKTVSLKARQPASTLRP